MKKITIVLIALMLVLVACDKKDASSESKDNGDTKDIFYAVGMFEAQKIGQLEPTDKELEQIFDGIRDSIKGKARLSDEEFQQQMMNINQLAGDRMKKQSDNAKEEGKKYLDKFAKKKGVEVTDSGLAYKVTKEGEGNKPAATDTVKVHYEGRLIDGTVFDSSKERGEPVEFPLNQVIPGWSEGLQYVKEGGSIELVIPSNLAYGDRSQTKIPGGSTLIFEVDLLEIVKAD